MSTRRDDVMAALRDWSKPGRRADLLAEAWQAGETNVSALAEAARISRPTVYADLKSRGIDPEDRPKGTPMMLATIDGLTGANSDTEGTVILEAVRAYAAKNGTDGIGEYESTLVRLSYALGAYNLIAAAQAAEQSARRDRDRALHLVEVRWEALSTATAWYAAHHAYVVAVDTARTAITTWADAARAAADAGWFPVRQVEELYRERILTAGHPPVERYTLDVDAASEQLRAELERKHEHRARLAGQTLTTTPAAT
ncbi:hypothetical protein ACFQ7A_04805 [Streptomyces sp. NPDC056528]|uniref:hypothetical protein n=1 Tax=Streptomyces sp. NPDC056528 TaxID=3345854 RepID=UPI00369E3D6C